MEELSYTSKYDGETTDKILDNAKAIMEQTTAEDGETVQVYDTDGVPHKISKTELLKKSTLALPALEDISSFVAVNAAGNAVGVMTKEQVASVLAGYGFLACAVLTEPLVELGDVHFTFYRVVHIVGSVQTGYFARKTVDTAYQTVFTFFTLSV